MRLIVQLLVTALTVFLAAQYIPGMEVDSIGGAILFALVLGLINLIVRPIVKILSLPITLLTLGLFSLVINALMFWLASALIDAVEVDGFIPAFFASLVVSIVTGILNLFIKK